MVHPRNVIRVYSLSLGQIMRYRGLERFSLALLFRRNLGAILPSRFSSRGGKQSAQSRDNKIVPIVRFARDGQRLGLG